MRTNFRGSFIKILAQLPYLRRPDSDGIVPQLHQLAFRYVVVDLALRDVQHIRRLPNRQNVMAGQPAGRFNVQ